MMKIVQKGARHVEINNLKAIDMKIVKMLHSNSRKLYLFCLGKVFRIMKTKIT